MSPKKKPDTGVRTIPKAATGIAGLDDVTFGGLPAGRPTLVCGSAGAGKTLLAAEILVRGATQMAEPGVFMTFEENSDELAANVFSLGFDLDALVTEGKLWIDHVRIERNEIEETGEYDLEGLFVRLDYAISRIGAKRVVLDTIEALFAGLPNHAVLRSELRRLFRWLKDRGMTAIITAERGETTLTRYGLEEYVADCVILLDHRVRDQVSTRRLRVMKYRGSQHGTNEYPFLIGKNGFLVMPVTSLGLAHPASTERVSTGIETLDDMLAGGGVFRGSSVLVSGAPGTGKSSVGVSFAYAACRRGEKALIFSYEESPEQLIRNMASIGLNLAKFVKNKLLLIHAVRPTLQGLEQHLMTMHDLIEEFKPSVVLVDPISNLSLENNGSDLKPMLLRLIDMIKSRGITAFFTVLTCGPDERSEDTQVDVSSLMDTWLLLRNVELNGERNRTMFVLKSRGMAHSNQVREFVMTDKGVHLVNVYLGSERFLTGTARAAEEEREEAERETRKRERQRRVRELAAKQKAIEAQIAALEAAAAAQADEVNFEIEQVTRAAESATKSNEHISRLRGGSK